MSSGGIAVLPAAVVVAAAGAVVVVAAASAVLVVNAAGAVAESAVRALGDYGRRLENEVAARHAGEVAARQWQCTAADVVGLNARIRMLAARARAAGVPVDVPPPFDLSGRTVDEARRWAATAQYALCQAQQTLETRVAHRERAALPVTAGTAPPAAAAALAGHREALQQRYAATAGPRRPAPGHVAPDEVAQLLAGLDVDADDADRAEVLAIAALAAEHRAPYLTQLRRRLHEVNDRVARRRAAAVWLEALEERTAAEAMAAAGVPEPLLGTVRRLREVVAGTEDLTPELRSEGIELVAWAGEVVRQRFIRDMVRTSLIAQGYRVEGEFDVEHSVGLRLSRAEWEGEHSADVWVDRTGAIEGRVRRELAKPGDEADSRDGERCDTFNDDLEILAGRVGGGDVHTRVEIDRSHRPQLRTSTVDVPETLHHNATQARHREK